MFARIAASAVAAFVFAVLAISSAESGEFPVQHALASMFSVATSDEQRQDPVTSSAKETAFDEPGLTKLVAPTVAHHSAGAEPFGLPTTTVSADPIVATWDIIENGIRADREALLRCRETTGRCSAAAQSFLAIVAEGRANTGRARIGVINRAINLTIKATSLNRWTTPLETFAMGRGDCKQYAIAKYLALIEAGFSENDVRLVILRNLATGDNHAVVAVRLNGDWIMLDNRWLNMVRDTEMGRMIPLFVLDRRGVKQFLPS
jgi:predicted transglutaminase-like cysteine proteinase